MVNRLRWNAIPRARSSWELVGLDEYRRRDSYVSRDIGVIHGAHYRGEVGPQDRLGLRRGAGEAAGLRGRRRVQTTIPYSHIYDRAGEPWKIWSNDFKRAALARRHRGSRSGLDAAYQRAFGLKKYLPIHELRSRFANVCISASVSHIPCPNGHSSMVTP